MKESWIDLGPLNEFPADRPVLKKDEAGRRYACVRQGSDIHAIDDRCPHQGYPLSQGTVKGGVLTCEWHNWKFELGSGACTFGGESVRRYPTKVEDGRVHLNCAVDRAAEVRRLLGGLRAALADDSPARALRDGIRLGELGLGVEGTGLGVLHTAFEVVARDGAERAEYGFDHGLAVLADLCSWVERGWIGGDEAFIAGAHAVAEPSIHLGPRGAPKPHAPLAPRDLRAALARVADIEEGDPKHVAEALANERRDEAEARVRALVESRGALGGHQALLPFVARHVYDYGHGAIFLAKALELGKRFPAAAVELMAASTVQLSWATAETSLPPFSATRGGLGKVLGLKLDDEPNKGHAGFDRQAYEDAVLARESEGVAATVARLSEGCDPVELLRASGHAAAVRLSRFDATWEARLDAEVNILDVTHAVTFIEAAIALAPGARRRHLAQLAVLAAGFLGKLRHADAKEPPKPGRAAADLVTAVEARDLGAALANVKELDAAGRLESYRKLAPFAAFDAAVRPIFYAHTVKNTEALHRLEAADPEADGAYLTALVSYLAPRRRENTARRTAAVARKFLRDGRPPEGLY